MTSPQLGNTEKPITLRFVVTVALLVALLAGMAALTSISGATLPGRNGDLLFQSYDNDGMPPDSPARVMTAHADGGAAISRTPPVDGFSENGTFAPDGRSIYFGMYDGIFSLRLTSKSPILAWGQQEPLRYDDPISVSPDGKSVLTTYWGYICDDNEKDCQKAHNDPANGIWVHDLKTGFTKKLKAGIPGNPYESIYSPDGKKIAVATAHLSGIGSSIYVTNADGSKPYRVARASWATELSYSPDGRFIAFTNSTFESTFRPYTDIWTAKSDGTQVVRRTFDTLSKDPVFSPDGTQMAYTQDGPSDQTTGAHESDIWTMDRGNWLAKPLVQLDGTETLLDWGRAGIFRIHGESFFGPRLAMTFYGPGKLVVTGPGLQTVRREFIQSGNRGIPLRPNRKLKSAVEKGKSFNLTVKLTFTPTGALPKTKTADITLRKGIRQ